jgi:NAD(P)-dependent dehydrogenase (short-subunit alcohol dehydrogenase family)/alkylhydroperoxidase family enzyme
MTTSVPAARGPRLADRVAIVTGAGSRADGIGNGRASAILMAREGARVALIDAVPEWAEQTRRMIEAEGGQSMVVPCDVTDPAACEAAVAATVKAWGRLDILVNNVGIGGPAGTAVEVDLAAWNHGLLSMSPMMLMATRHPRNAQAGCWRNVNVASVAGLLGGHPACCTHLQGGGGQHDRAMAAHGTRAFASTAWRPAWSTPRWSICAHDPGDATRAGAARCCRSRVRLGRGLRCVLPVSDDPLGHRHRAAGGCRRDRRLPPRGGAANGQLATTTPTHHWRHHARHPDGSAAASDPALNRSLPRSARRIDRVPDLYRLIGHSPALLRAWIDFAWPLRLNAKTSRATRELLILRGAQIGGVDYEWAHHVPMALDAGVPQAKIDALADWPNASVFDAPSVRCCAWPTRSLADPAPARPAWPNWRGISTAAMWSSSRSPRASMCA